MIAAQRVPPSASSTSQSTQTVRSPSASKSTTPRSERPISRWISTVRPSGRPLDTSRFFRSPVEAGSIEYSAVTQPRPLPAIQRGTASSTLAVQITRVPPASISAEPVAVRTKPGVMTIGRSSSGSLPSFRFMRLASRGRAASTRPIGSWRNRVPSRRNSSGSPVAMNS